MTTFIRLGARSAVILAMFALVAVAAMYRETTGATFGTFTTGGIDLQIDSKAWYNGVALPSATWAMKNLSPTADKFFNFPDIKPGDFGCEVVSMHVKKGEAWLCLDFKNFQSADNTQNEPESLVDPNGVSKGELADNLQFFGWIDNGDGKYQKTEKALFGTSTKAASTVLNDKSYAVGDSKNGNSCRQNDSRYVAMCWCAGILSVDMNTGKMNCDGSKLGNIAQTDSMKLDVAVRALSSTGDPKFLCNPAPPPPPPPPKCEKDRYGKWKDQYGKACKHVPKDKNECKDDGWKSCKDNRGTDFKSQKECTNYVDSHTDRYGRYHD